MPPEARQAQQAALHLYAAAARVRAKAELLATLAMAEDYPVEFVTMALERRQQADRLSQLATEWLVVAMEAAAGCDD